MPASTKTKAIPWDPPSWVMGRFPSRFPSRTSFWVGQNGQIPPFSEIYSKKTLFWNYIGKYHFLWYSSFLNSSSYKFYHRGTTEMEIGQLKKIIWYLSMVNSSTMQHNTRVYQALVPFYNKMLYFFFFLFLRYSSLPSSSTL